MSAQGRINILKYDVIDRSEVATPPATSPDSAINRLFLLLSIFIMMKKARIEKRIGTKAIRESYLFRETMAETNMTIVIIRRGRLKGVVWSLTFPSRNILTQSKIVPTKTKPISKICLGSVKASVVTDAKIMGRVKKNKPTTIIETSCT